MEEIEELEKEEVTEEDIQGFVEKWGIDHGEEGIEMSDCDWRIFQDLIAEEAKE